MLRLRKTISFLLGAALFLGLPAGSMTAYAIEGPAEHAMQENEDEEKWESASVSEMLELPHREENILVVYKNDSQAYALEAEGGSYVTEIDGHEVLSIPVKNVESLEELLTSYQEREDVLYACPDYEFSLLEDMELPNQTINDPDLYSQNYLNVIGAYGAWNLLSKYTHEKVRVCVLDTGADFTHPDLARVINRDLSVELMEITDVTDPGLAPLKGDDYSLGTMTAGKGHGTHVCGLIAAEAMNQTGICGAASAYKNDVVDLVVADIFRTGTSPTSFVLRGLDYAKAIGAEIVNTSLGIAMSTIAEGSSTVELLERKCKELHDAGILLVCAAGNDNLKDEGELSMIPADFDSCMGVVWVDPNGNRGVSGLSASNYGLLKDIAAPGTMLYSVASGGGYARKSGTSMATPLVTAAAAMVRSISKTYTPMDVLRILKETSQALDDPELSNIGMLRADRAAVFALAKKPIPFTDVKQELWYYDTVRENYLRGIMTGMSETRFAPANPVGRAQFATVIYRMEGSQKIPYQKIFADVPENAWYTDAVTWAFDQGIITGYQNGTFGPANTITREQLATMLYRYAKYLGLDVSAEIEMSNFKDLNKISEFAWPAMVWAVGSGIITGKNPETLSPQGQASRAECATMVVRFLNYYGK